MSAALEPNDVTPAPAGRSADMAGKLVSIPNEVANPAIDTSPSPEYRNGGPDSR
jgi:hypothetical protein